MSDEYDSNNVYYSPFWPMTIVLAGFILWLGYQIFVMNEQRMSMNAQFEQVKPMLGQAQMAQQRLVALMKDLADTSANDQYAKQIMKEAVDAGLLRVTPNTNAPAASAAPASAGDSTTAPTK